MTKGTPPIRVGMVGVGMIFDDTYRPLFESADPPAALFAVASRTGARAERLRSTPTFGSLHSHTGADSVSDLVAGDLDTVCVATPDERHFGPARAALAAGKHLLVEKPSVLSLHELDQLCQLAREHGVLAKVVYHKLLDPDHMMLRTHYIDGVLKHVNNGYCSLLEPKSIGAGQFAEWITGRNPASYVAVHYIKLIDFTFGPGWNLTRIMATGQRGIIAAPDSPTWDSVQMQITYRYHDNREASFDIHTSWVTPDNFPGYVEQEVQFRFDNAVWSASQRQRGVEVTVEGATPHTLKNTPNHHYSAAFLEPWGERSRRGYGIEAVRRFFEEVAYVEHGGAPEDRPTRLRAMRDLAYNDLSADRNCVAAVQAVEAILREHAAGNPGGVVRVNGPAGGLALYVPGRADPTVLYEMRV